MARGDTERGGGAAGGADFPEQQSSLRLFTTKKNYNYLCQNYIPSLALAPRPRAPGQRSRGALRRWPPRAQAQAHTACASGRHPSLRYTPLTTECHVPLRRLTLSECSDPRPGSQCTQTSDDLTHTRHRRVRTYTSQQSRQRSPLASLWRHVAASPICNPVCRRPHRT